MDKHISNDNPWWKGDWLNELRFARNSILTALLGTVSSSDAVLLSGTRGVGKTVLLKQLAHQIISSKHIDAKTILYLNLENICYLEWTLYELLIKFKQINKLAKDDRVVVILDEIGSSSKRIDELVELRQVKGVKVYFSSSYEVDTRALGNKIKRYQLMPLDFYEYLELRGIELNSKTMHLLDEYFQEYMHSGGMPGCVGQVQDGYAALVDKIVTGDVAARYGLKDMDMVKGFFLGLIENAGKDYSINDLAKQFGISPDTAKRYLNYFQEVYLIDLVEKWSPKSSFRSAKKIYLRDLGLYNLSSRRILDQVLFDNYIYLQLKGATPKFVKEDDLDLGLLIKGDYLVKANYGGVEDEYLSKVIMRTPFKEKVVVSDYKGFQKIL